MEGRIVYEWVEERRNGRKGRTYPPWKEQKDERLETTWSERQIDECVDGVKGWRMDAFQCDSKGRYETGAAWRDT